MKPDAADLRRTGVNCAALALAAAIAAGCVAPPRSPAVAPAYAFADAEALFHRDPRWLGGDAALSIALGRERTLWLFGDSFVARTKTHVRQESEMVRNTLAVQSGRDPRSATITFHWGQRDDGVPAAFFRGREESWYWPGHGVRLRDGPVLIFLYTMMSTPGRGLGFAATGYAVAIIDNPDSTAEHWRPRIIDAPRLNFDALPATAVIQEDGYLVALAIRQEGTHAGTLVRYPLARLAKGDLTGAQWWAGAARGWLAESALGAGGPTFVLDDAGAECSLHWDAQRGRYLHVASYGFGATTIGVRFAPALTGPWSSPTVVYRPPESTGPRPFVYAAKAHPELTANRAGDLVVTYATNSFEFADLFTPQGASALYWPRVVVLPADRSD